MKRFLAPLLIGLIGTAILLGLGRWQLQRLEWKEGVISAIDAQIRGVPEALPDAPTEADRYKPVRLEGRFTGDRLLVLVGHKEMGPGFRVIAAYETAGRRIMVDRGFIYEAWRNDPMSAAEAEVNGNLHWPEEVDSYTPAPEGDLWFARDVPAMASALGTEPVLVVARTPTGDGVIPLPIDTAAIPNDHLGYALTWFSLAAVWVGMTLLWLWRIRRRGEGNA